LRESNATLRAESESAAKKTRDLESKLNALSQELDPAKEQARSAQAELEATKVQMQRLEQETRRWQERNTQLLSKVSSFQPKYSYRFNFSTSTTALIHQRSRP
jgi:nucleoprotein TPR